MPPTEVVSKTKTQRCVCWLSTLQIHIDTCCCRWCIHRSILTFLRLWFDRYPTDWTPSLTSQLTVFLQQHQQPYNSLDISDLLQHTSSTTLSSPPSSPPSSQTCTYKIQLAAECLNFTLYTLSPPLFAQALTARDAVSGPLWFLMRIPVSSFSADIVQSSKVISMSTLYSTTAANESWDCPILHWAVQ